MLRPGGRAVLLTADVRLVLGTINNSVFWVPLRGRGTDPSNRAGQRCRQVDTEEPAPVERLFVRHGPGQGWVCALVACRSAVPFRHASRRARKRHARAVPGAHSRGAG